MLQRPIEQACSIGRSVLGISLEPGNGRGTPPGPLLHPIRPAPQLEELVLAQRHGLGRLCRMGHCILLPIINSLRPHERMVYSPTLYSGKGRWVFGEVWPPKPSCHVRIMSVETVNHTHCRGAQSLVENIDEMSVQKKLTIILTTIAVGAAWLWDSCIRRPRFCWLLLVKNYEITYNTGEYTKA